MESVHIIGNTEWLILIFYLVIVSAVCLIALWNWMEKEVKCKNLSEKFRRRDREATSYEKQLKTYTTLYGNEPDYNGRHIDRRV